MNMLVSFAPSDVSAWKEAFDADYEDRMNAGLTVLQLWRDADGSGVVALFDVNDRGKAEAWAKKERATGTGLETRFLSTF